MDFQTLWQVIFLGVVQGIAEFLPISSSGHLVILGALLPGETRSLDENLALNVALHLGTLGSILVVYRRDLPRLLRDGPMLAAIIVATLPVVVVGLTLKETLEVAFSTPAVAACGLLVTGSLLWLCEWIEPVAGSADEISPAPPRLSQALAIGLFQALALVPGISRSGSTIAGGVMCGVSRSMAARFSFLIAIPAISGATLLHLIDLYREEGALARLGPELLVGALVSFVVGIVALEGLLKLVRQKRLRWFAAYCVVAALATWTALYFQLLPG